MKKRNFTLGVLSLMTVGVLSGCGGGNTSAVTPIQDTFSNLLGLDGGEVVGISRAEVAASAPTAEQAHSKTFEDQTLGGRPRQEGGKPTLGEGRPAGNGRPVGDGRPAGDGRPIGPKDAAGWKIGQGVGKSVRVRVAEGVVLPASFSLSNIVMTLRVTDGERVAEKSTTIAGPVTYTRSGDSNTYVTESEITPEVVFTEGSFETLHAILTTPPSPNTATATLRYDASSELPTGAKINFGLRGGHARLQ
jgi:hypothetical protein